MPGERANARLSCKRGPSWARVTTFSWTTQAVLVGARATSGTDEDTKTMREGGGTTPGGSSAAARVRFCPCCRRLNLELGNVHMRLAPAGATMLACALESLADECSPARVAVTVADGVTLLVTPGEARELTALLAQAPAAASAAELATAN